MLLSASILLLAAGSPAAGSPVATEITPISLATAPVTVDLGDATYDWSLQQSRGLSGLKLADSTANCNTCCIATQSSGKTDQVHDCGFD